MIDYRLEEFFRRIPLLSLMTIRRMDWLEWEEAVCAEISRRASRKRRDAQMITNIRRELFRTNGSRPQRPQPRPDAAVADIQTLQSARR